MKTEQGIEKIHTVSISIPNRIRKTSKWQLSHKFVTITREKELIRKLESISTNEKIHKLWESRMIQPNEKIHKLFQFSILIPNRIRKTSYIPSYNWTDAQNSQRGIKYAYQRNIK
jgi:hypothetical protein